MLLSHSTMRLDAWGTIDFTHFPTPVLRAVALDD